jgi:signal transduction histidine kinase
MGPDSHIHPDIEAETDCQQPVTLSPPEASAKAGWSGGVHLESLANFAHELRTPVQVLLGYLDILCGEWIGAAATLTELANRTIIERMNANVHELAQTVENVLDFALEYATVETAPEEEIELAEFFAELDEVLKASTRNGNLTVRFDLDRAPRKIITRRRALRSIVLNLASNAIKFTNVGEVVISASRHDPQNLLVEVRDTGVGINGDLLSSAFEPLVQLSQSSSRRHRGLGLGLAVVQRNVKALGGRVWVESAPGAGSCFKVAIPCLVSVQTTPA